MARKGHKLGRPHHPPIRSRSTDEPTTSLGIDIGGTSIRAARVDTSGAIRQLELAPTPARGDPQTLCATLQALRTRLADDAGEAVAVALPGIWDRRSGRMQRAVNLPGLEGTNLFEFFDRLFDRPALLDSDVNAAAIAQAGACTPPAARCVYLSLGTGVGGAVLIDGMPLRHTSGGAGSLGFLLVDPAESAPAALTGVRGCLSEFASGAALRDEAARDAAVAALAIAIHQLAHLYAPELVLLGGGVVDGWTELPELVSRRFAAGPRRIVSDPRILRAPLPSHEAGVRGAAVIAAARSRERGDAHF